MNFFKRKPKTLEQETGEPKTPLVKTDGQEPFTTSEAGTPKQENISDIGATALTGEMPNDDAQLPLVKLDGQGPAKNIDATPISIDEDTSNDGPVEVHHNEAA